jgi:hypothetical protein
MSSAPPAPPSATPIVTLLSRLALAIARRRSYGDVHPIVIQADEALAEALLQHIEAHSSFAIAVANRDLLVNGEVMPASGVVVRDIATRLHLLGIGAVRFQRGITLPSLGTLLSLLARRPSDTDEPTVVPDMQGIIVGRLDYEQLGLADDATLRAEGELLWQALAARAQEQMMTANLDTGEGASAGGVTAASQIPTSSSDSLAQLIAGAATDPSAASAAFRVLSDLAERVSMTPRTVRDTVGEQLDALFATLDDAALVATLRAGPSPARLRFSGTIVDVLPGTSMLRWLSVSAQANGRELSPHMLRILTKMTAHQEARSAEAGDQSLRETVMELVQGWEVTEPNPEEHHQLLDMLAECTAHDGRAPHGDDLVHLDPISHEAIRLVQMACELDHLSGDAVQAVRHLADQGFTAQLLEWAEQAPTAETRRRLRELSITPQAVSDTLLATPFDAVAAKPLLDAIPDSTAALLIEPLEHCQSRTGRRLILNRLQAAGKAIEPALRERLTQPMPWYLARNLLGLLRDIAASADEVTTPASVPPGALLLLQSHEHAQVRREAVRVLAQYPETRVASLRRALDDMNGDVRMTAIDVMLTLRDVEWPRELITRLLTLAENETVEMSVRDKAVRAAAQSTHPEVRTWLTAQCTRRGLLKGVKLAPLTPLVRCALQQLATRFADHADVAPVLALARRDGVLAAPEREVAR